MEHRMGMAQRRMRRMTVHWGPHSRTHLALLPIFDSSYKVLGMVGLDADAEQHPVWYPGNPLTVEPRRMVFKSSLSDAPPQWNEIEPGLLEDSYFHDPWGAIHALVPRVPGAPSLEGAVNLAGNRIRGQPIMDVVYEPTLHRVRALQLRGRWGRSRTVPILRLPGLRESLERGPVPQLDVDAYGPPPERPEGWISKLLRRVVEPLLQEPPPERPGWPPQPERPGRGRR